MHRNVVKKSKWINVVTRGPEMKLHLIDIVESPLQDKLCVSDHVIVALFVLNLVSGCNYDHTFLYIIRPHITK